MTPASSVGERVVVLLSMGRHPVSGQPRMAPDDRQALELALRSGRPVSALHAGPGDPDVLRAYLGMGLDAIRHIRIPAASDAIVPLRSAIQELDAGLVLTGRRSETGWGSGMLAYRLANDLGWPMLSDVTGFEAAGKELAVYQAVPGGRRRLRIGRPPAVLSAAAQAPTPRLSAYAARRRGVIDARVPAPQELMPAEAWPETRPARRRAVRLRPSRDTAPAERRVLADLDADTAAGEILDYLRRCGLLPAGDAAATTSFDQETH